MKPHSSNSFNVCARFVKARTVVRRKLSLVVVALGKVLESVYYPQPDDLLIKMLTSIVSQAFETS
jgi:hypothetical protein